MALRAFTHPNNVAMAYAEFARHFESGGEVLERSIGYRGGSRPATIRWFADLNFWVMLQPDGLPRYWCAFGVDDPHQFPLLSITCEINPPREGIDRRSAAVFVRSDNATIYLAHSGRLGGGRVGISKAMFLAYYGDETVDAVKWPDGQSRDYIVIGALEDDGFRSTMADFVHTVARFRA